MDLSLMALLVDLGLPVFWANMLGATVAITFVFSVAQRRIFVSDGHVLLPKFAVYFLYQSMVIPLASLGIHALAALLEGANVGAYPPFDLLPSDAARQAAVSVLAKGLATPATLYSNFLFMGWLLERRLSFW